MRSVTTMSTPAQNEVTAVKYSVRSVLKSSEKGDIQLVESENGRLYVRKYREIPPELFRRARAVQCPYLERLTEQSEDENGKYCISEYVQGTPASERTFTEKEAISALLELCAALKALHNAGIIHRDVKPSNIVCGSDGHIRLIDLDSARLEKTSRSHDTEMLGTAGFAPPEQYGFMQTDSRSDIYSFGVTMEEILGAGARRLKYRRIIDRCTQFDPERRYSDFTAVSRAISRAARTSAPAFAAAAALLTAALCLCLPHIPPAAHDEDVSTAENTDYTAQDDTAESTDPAPQYATAESTDPAPQDATAESTAPAPQDATAESTDPAPQDDTAESTAPAPQDDTVEDPPPEETPAAEAPAPIVLSDSVNPNKITFVTTQRSDGLYTDEFDYVFYDDPAVHGEWRLYGLLPPNVDFTALTPEQLEFTPSFGDYVWQYLSISADGTYTITSPEHEVSSRSQWTNGYYIFHDGSCSFAARLFAVTVDGTEYLMYEQKPTGNAHSELPHRFLVFKRE